MSILHKVGVGVLIETAVRLITFIVDRVYDYKEKKLQKKTEEENCITEETFEDGKTEDTTD